MRYDQGLQQSCRVCRTTFFFFFGGSGSSRCIFVRPSYPSWKDQKGRGQPLDWDEDAEDTPCRGAKHQNDPSDSEIMAKSISIVTHAECDQPLRTHTIL